MRSITKRLASLTTLSRPLLLTAIGVVIMSLGLAYFFIAIYRTVELPSIFYYLTLQFMPRWSRGLLLLLIGGGIFAIGLWRLSNVVIFSLQSAPTGGEMVLGYQRAFSAPNIAVLSGGPGMLILASLGQQVKSITCVTPLQDPVEYYYRASSLFHFENVHYIAPTVDEAYIQVQLDDQSIHDLRQNLSHVEVLAQRHVVGMKLMQSATNQPIDQLPVTARSLEAIREADAIIFGPGSLFESILPNMLLPELREAIQNSKAKKIYICNLMTEPSLTTGFGVADHVRQLIKYGGFSPDYVLVNAQRIDPDVHQMYRAANQSPVYLSPEEYEETAVSSTDRITAREVLLEGAVVIEADLASSQLQLTASLDSPGESRTVRVLRHDPDKLATAIIEILRRG
jgi:hypothetical protein